jgi:hypothetical protein
MSPHSQPLDELLVTLRQSMGSSVALHVLEQREDCLTLRVGREADAVVGVQVTDPGKPSFRLSYPELTVKRNGERRVTVTCFEGAAQQGVEWVIRQVADHGAVWPEFLK